MVSALNVFSLNFHFWVSYGMKDDLKSADGPSPLSMFMFLSVKGVTSQPFENKWRNLNRTADVSRLWERRPLACLRPNFRPIVSNPLFVLSRLSTRFGDSRAQLSCLRWRAHWANVGRRSQRTLLHSPAIEARILRESGSECLLTRSNALRWSRRLESPTLIGRRVLGSSVGHATRWWGALKAGRCGRCWLNNTHSSYTSSWVLNIEQVHPVGNRCLFPSHQ